MRKSEISVGFFLINHLRNEKKSGASVISQSPEAPLLGTVCLLVYCFVHGNGPTSDCEMRLSPDYF